MNKPLARPPFTIARATPWRNRYGSMEASELKKVKKLEEKNTKLKRMNADRLKAL